MNSLPDRVHLLLRQFNLQSEEVIHWLQCDRHFEGGFTESYLILTEEYIYQLTNRGEPLQTKVFKGVQVDVKETANPVAEFELYTYRIELIEGVYISDLVASGMMIAKTTEEKILGIFTNGHMRSAIKFCKLVEKMKQSEKIDTNEKDDASKFVCPICKRMYPDQDRQVCPYCIKKGAIFKRLLHFTIDYKYSLFFIVLFMLLNSVTSLIIPYLQGKVLFDQALGGTGRFAGQIVMVIVMIIIVRTISLVFGTLFGIINARVAADIVFDLKANIFSSMQRLSLSFFQRRQTGQLMTRINDDANELQYFFIDGIPYFIVNAMNIIGVLIMLLIMDWKLTLLTLIPLPIVIILIQRVFPKLWRMGWRRHRKQSSMNSIISDNVRSARIVKAFGKEKLEIDRFGHSNEAYSHAEQRFSKMNSTVFPIVNMLTQIGGIIIWAFGGWKVMKGQMTFGEIMTFITYLTMLFGPIQYMNNIASWWSSSMSAAQRIFEVQDAVPEVTEKTNAIHIERINGEIEVNQMSFSYEANKQILKSIDLRAKPGQMIGIVGPSGAGKSTLVNLISRLYDVDEGEIKMDGINIKDVTSATLRNNIGIVSQEVYVFMGTVAENIAYAKPNCTMEEIIHAAKIANAHDFIESLPDGYDTLVGTSGYSLSGGEKQRLSIARAILHNPKILILDEATASLDTETELQIQEALEALAKGRTTIAIAHRLSTLRNADYLYVIKNGEVDEAGTHSQLMELDGMYAGMVRKHEEALKMKEVI